MIVDKESGMRVHLQLNGIFSFFPTRNLIPYEVEHWNTYPIVFLTPDGDSWDPNLTHYVEQEASMLDSSGLIAVHEERPSTSSLRLTLGSYMQLPGLGRSSTMWLTLSWPMTSPLKGAR